MENLNLLEYKKNMIILTKLINQMLDYARKLSSEFIFVRVDFYNIEGKIYLGELTFSPSNLLFGLKNREQSIYLGNFIDLINLS
jgi:hypothetical protein